MHAHSSWNKADVRVGTHQTRTTPGLTTASSRNRWRGGRHQQMLAGEGGIA